jgi:hypothetical protein
MSNQRLHLQEGKQMEKERPTKYEITGHHASILPNENGSAWFRLEMSGYIDQAKIDRLISSWQVFRDELDAYMQITDVDS